MRRQPIARTAGGGEEDGTSEIQQKSVSWRLLGVRLLAVLENDGQFIETVESNRMQIAI